ncbi:MAG: hypothetical protein AB9897_04360 [Anaerolineaceae bacterium]
MNGLLAELGIVSPWLNAPGFLGFHPPAHLEFPEKMGAFLPAPLSLNAQSPVPDRAVLPYPGGVLLHSGLPNPGLAAAIRQYRGRWSKLAVPLWMSLLPHDAADAEELAEQVDELDSAVTFQVCLPRDSSIKAKAAILAAVQGEKPFFVELPLDVVCREMIEIIQKSAAVGIVVTAPRGTLPLGDTWVNGRLYGAALYPQIVQSLTSLVETNLAIVAGCGVKSVEMGKSLLRLGAAALQVDLALWG